MAPEKPAAGPPVEPKAADGDEEGEPPPQGAAETERGAQEADETEEAQEGTARAQGRTGQDSESWRVVSVYDTRMAWTKFMRPGDRASPSYRIHISLRAHYIVLRRSPRLCT